MGNSDNLNVPVDNTVYETVGKSREYIPAGSHTIIRLSIIFFHQALFDIFPGDGINLS